MWSRIEGYGRGELMSEISPRRAQTRERLFEAAFRVLARDGLAAASIEAIVAEAGFTRGAFYSNFATKEELFAGVIEREMRKRLQAVSKAAQALTRADVPRPVTADFIRMLLEEVIVDPETEREWQIIMTEIELDSLRNPGATSRLPEPDLAYVDDVAAALLPAMQQLGIRFEGDPEVAIRLLINGYLGAARQALRSHPSHTNDAIAPQLEWFTMLVEKFLRG